MWWLYAAGAVILLVGAASAFWAFQRPSFVAGLASVITTAVIKAILPKLLKRKSPEEEAEDHRRAREGKSGGIHRGKIRS